MLSCKIKYTTYVYSGLEAIKASRRGGVPLSWCHIIAEATSPV
jgi:hypothetical protein